MKTRFLKGIAAAVVLAVPAIAAAQDFSGEPLRVGDLDRDGVVTREEADRITGGPAHGTTRQLHFTRPPHLDAASNDETSRTRPQVTSTGAKPKATEIEVEETADDSADAAG